MRNHLFRYSAAMLFALCASGTQAKVDAGEAAKLGKTLTTVGAEPGANKDGSIPAWKATKQKGTLTEFPADAVLEAQKPKFTITKANMAQYAGMLTEGHKKLLSSYDTYKMNVYPTTRDVTWPDFIQKATVANATTCQLVNVDTLDNCTAGFPFPIPKSGAEVIWNHRLKWHGNNVRRFNNQIIVQPDGNFQLTRLIEDVKFSYATDTNPVTLTKDSGQFLKYFSKTVAPPRLAGTMILVHERAGAGNDGRAAWLYSPGLKRIRRAPTVCCDNPYEGTDGHQFYDQVDMFNGSMDRFDWKLIGKKEIFIPYHSTKIAGATVKYKDMARPKHLNQDLPRYEQHRVWVVESTIREGTNHTFHKRRLYVDEDSWNIVAIDDYDSRGGLYEFQEGHLVFAPNILTVTTAPEVIYHFTSGRYFLTAMFNEDQAPDLTVKFDDAYFEAASVQKRSNK